MDQKDANTSDAYLDAVIRQMNNNPPKAREESMPPKKIRSKRGQSAPGKVPLRSSKP